MIFFDHNATVPLHPAARQAWLDVADRAWHNPSGLYAAATAARDVLHDCRERLADILDCEVGRIVFCAGATAANNAIARHVGSHAADKGFAVVSAIEHPCVAEPFAASFRGRVREIAVDRRGVVSVDEVETVLATHGRDAVIVSVMAASNESGTVQPWGDVAGACRRLGVPFHADAAQWLGKLPARGLAACDWVTGSSHKFGGPKGAGFILVPESDRSFRGDRGGPQEAGRHAGTEDVASIAAMVAVLEVREREIAGRLDSLAAARDGAERRLRERVPSAIVIGGDAPRLWNTLAAVIPGVDGKRLVARLDRLGIAASTGSACSGGSDAAARIVAAIGAARLGIGESDLRGMVRLSGGWETTAEEWLAAVDAVAAAAVGDHGPPKVSLTHPT